MGPFDVPQPPAPTAGGAFDASAWDLFLRWHALKQAHEIATVREASDAAVAAANRALADAQETLGAAMIEAARTQLQAAAAPEPQKSEVAMLQALMIAFAGAGVDSACLQHKAQAAMNAQPVRPLPPGPVTGIGSA